MPQKPTTPESFWSKADKSGPCWLWQGSTADDGYGKVSYQNRSWRAHRLAYLFAHGALPADRLVCHTCDTPLCVNPDHLFLGTALDNSRDALSKGRLVIDRPLPVVIGAANSNAKMTPDSVRALRQRAAEIGPKYTQLGREFGLHKKTIRAILDGQTWRHVA